MKRRRDREDDTPRGGWLSPPRTTGLAPIATAVGVDKKGRWKWKEHNLSSKERKAHRRFQQQMADGEI